MISNTDFRYFNKAHQVAKISDYKKQHIGCVAVYQGQVIGLGCNCNKTHPTQKYYNQYREQSDSMLPKLHAEISSACFRQSFEYYDTANNSPITTSPLLYGVSIDI